MEVRSCKIHDSDHLGPGCSTFQNVLSFGKTDAFQRFPIYGKDLVPHTDPPIVPDGSIAAHTLDHNIVLTINCKTHSWREREKEREGGGEGMQCTWQSSTLMFMESADSDGLCTCITDLVWFVLLVFPSTLCSYINMYNTGNTVCGHFAKFRNITMVTKTMQIKWHNCNKELDHG